MMLVSSYNEWDPLEEVIVGSVQGAAKMGFEPSVNAYYLKDDTFRQFKGTPHRQEAIEKAETQLNQLAAILTAEGVVVKRPDPLNHAIPIKTMDFEVQVGNCSACPRDVLLVIGEEIIEAPMAQRARFFEYSAYRSLVKDYFLHGAKWTTAPKPLMSNALYTPNFFVTDFFNPDETPPLTSLEPCFDAASFIRFGKDIFYQLDLVTNAFGVTWLQRHLGEDYRLHRMTFKDKRPPQHIDTTLVPVRPGLVLVNPERPCIDGMLNLFYRNNWEIIKAPPSVRGSGSHSPEVSNWISMNILSIDEERVIVEEKEEPTIRLLESLGSKVITCPFEDVYQFGGGFHCCTVDIRRKGVLKSYFPTLED